ncbi:MAG: hypothetical protein Ct9H90mP13_05110 [Pseudomonadota bacterium]|nr:MAG: hypothetical protein Ct9H90mP13_05110 [Pseudomonadota bacterium]
MQWQHGSDQAAGGEPANFLDVGGGATTDRVKMAIDIIMENPNVDGILINIFGGLFVVMSSHKALQKQ